MVCQRFLTSVDAEGQFVAVRSASLIVLYMNGDQVAARVLGRASQGQVAAGDHINAFHTAVGISGRFVFRIGFNFDRALAAIQTDLGLVVEFLPVAVGRFGILLHQCAVHRDRTVLVAGGTAGAGAGNAVVILLADNSGFKAAYDFHMQLQRIAAFRVGRNGCVSILVDDQLEGQVFVAIGGDGDDVAAFQNVRSVAVFFLGKYQNQCFGTGHIV